MDGIGIDNKKRYDTNGITNAREGITFPFSRAIGRNRVRDVEKEGALGSGMPPVSLAFTKELQAGLATSSLRERISDLVVVTDMLAEEVSRSEEEYSDAELQAELSIMRQMGLPCEFKASNYKKHKESTGRAEKVFQRARAPHPKYWHQRYLLFSKFDQGIVLDEEGWYSVTPEAIAIHHAHRCACALALDPFVGVGGDAIALARTCGKVIGIDISEERLLMARKNASVYSVQNNIEFICAESTSVWTSFKPDVIYMSPPWGGMDYATDGKDFELSNIHAGSLDGAQLLRQGLSVTPNIALFLPRNTCIDSIATIAEETGLPCEVEYNWVPSKMKGKRLKAMTAYFGKLAQSAPRHQGI